MEAFAELVDKLYFTSSNLAKSAILRDYLRSTPDPDRGWAIAAIAGTLNFDLFKRKLIKDLIVERVDPVLFELSYDYVGEMSETVAHLWPTPEPSEPHENAEQSAFNKQAEKPLPSLSEVVKHFQNSTKQEVQESLIDLLNVMTPNQRWALIKLGTRGLRIGLSARFLKKILAEYAQISALTNDYQQTQEQITVEDIERVWHGVEPPYIDLFAWLEGKAAKPDISKKITFQPVMLSHPVDEELLPEMLADAYESDSPPGIASERPQAWQAEWKFDGIRVQLVVNENGKALFSRTGDDISHSFPDLLSSINAHVVSGVFDGELLAMHDGEIQSFNRLQQRLNKKKPTKKLMSENPVGMVLYDALFIDGKDLRECSLADRVDALHAWHQDKHEHFKEANQKHPVLRLSQALKFSSLAELRKLREQANHADGGFIEGLMLKKRDGRYVAGRPKGQWYKWKRDAKLIDAVIMYAQRGHGKRSSFYSDYTFGCWQDDTLLPIGKAYSGFTDAELKEIDKWVRRNTLGRFGPVKEVKKELVFEVAFDSVHESKRHKSGLALRFPRIHRIRWDKPAAEADMLSTLRSMIEK
ncbi:cisplatin damage response ATP-dependent DNA ligase [Glaciecola sp. MH2013]|uniref:cisplatin damage response ATP-dependent DNA ligase n=1 Tax=Glaciecola sp. MH2013 TaxID=2785524 RepID=UPI00189CC87C|nr:cisplatin damage response ATP-dependent DNA ligase [Glaciecola sp. MH2013]MBF7074095.1 cisplatin damage response ATP-dependent DNA ligase [Glaciecola sp. MH2013]